MLDVETAVENNKLVILEQLELVNFLHSLLTMIGVDLEIFLRKVLVFHRIANITRPMLICLKVELINVECSKYLILRRWLRINIVIINS